MSFKLLKERRFAPFFWTQFLGAGNDNIFKFAFTLLVTYQTAKYSTLDIGILVNAISGLFILPFLLFSATSGQLADKFDKTTLMRGVKLLEIGIMLIAALGFYQHSATLLLTCTFLLGLHSTLFGPAKYAYLPEHLNNSEVVGGNGLVEMGTFIAILLGTISGGLLVEADSPLLLSGTVIVLSLLGFGTAMLMPKTPSRATELAINWNPFSETWKNLKYAHKTRSVFLSLLGISWLWFFGAIFLTQFAPFAKNVLHAQTSVVTLLLGVFSIGIAFGSVLCEKLSGKQVEIGLVPFGSIGMSLFSLDLYFACQALPQALSAWSLTAFIQEGSHIRIMIDLFLMAMFSGFYSVPLYSLIQTRTEPEYRARVVAANNILNALFMITSAGFAAFVFSGLHWTIPQLFLAVSALNACVAIYIYTVVPEFLIRFIAWMLIHTVYTLRKVNTQIIPEEGAALLICNHVSFVDAIILMAVSPRPIRFVMDHHIFKIPVISYVFKHAKAIPIASAKVDAVMLSRAYDLVDQALSEGELVCIFPEGRITDTGKMYHFKNGVTQIVTRRPVPIIPVALCGLWGSFFSRYGGKAMSIKNIGMASTVEIQVGQPTQEPSPELLQAEIQRLIDQAQTKNKL